MTIGLFGGTFNPPHLGHLWIAQQVLDFTDVDQVWFLPTNQHTFHKPVLLASHRLEMVRLAVQSKFVTSSLEIDHSLDGNTIHLLPHLPPQHTYRFIIGSDQLPTFHLWGDWEILLKSMPFLVFPRYGYPSELLYPGMKLINDAQLVVSNISSTKIRERLRRGMSVDQFVSRDVELYITSNKLYA